MIIKLTLEQQNKLVENLIKEDITSDEFWGGDEYQELIDALYKKKRLVSIVNVNKEGDVRVFLAKGGLNSYEKSDKPKTEKQLNSNKNNNLITVVDFNLYKKRLHELGDKAEAARKSFRRVNLHTVLGFLYDRKFVDLREKNDILGRFGEDIYDSLTPNMEKARQELENANNDDNINESKNSGGYKIYHNSFKSLCDEVKDYIEKKGYEYDDDEWFSEVSTSKYGRSRPKEGETHKFSISLTKEGKKMKKMLHFQAYGMENGKFELNLYIN